MPQRRNMYVTLSICSTVNTSQRRNMYVTLSICSTVNTCHREEMLGNKRNAITLETKEIIDLISSGKTRQINVMRKYDLGKSTVNTIWKNRKRYEEFHLEYVVLGEHKSPGL